MFHLRYDIGFHWYKCTCFARNELIVYNSNRKSHAVLFYTSEMYDIKLNYRIIAVFERIQL